MKILTFVIIILADVILSEYLVSEHCGDDGIGIGKVSARLTQCTNGTIINCDGNSIVLEEYENQNCSGSITNSTFLNDTCSTGGFSYSCSPELPLGYCYLEFYDKEDLTCQNEIIEPIQGYVPFSCIVDDGSSMIFLNDNDFYAIQISNETTCYNDSGVFASKIGDCVEKGDTRTKAVCKVNNSTYGDRIYYDPEYNGTNLIRTVFENCDGNLKCTSENLLLTTVSDGDEIIGSIFKHCNVSMEECTFICSNLIEMENPIELYLYQSKCNILVAKIIQESDVCLDDQKMELADNRLCISSCEEQSCSDLENQEFYYTDTCYEVNNDFSVIYNFTLTPIEPSPLDSKNPQSVTSSILKLDVTILYLLILLIWL